jgi:hypothetical protein
MPADLSMIQEEIKSLKETLGEHGSFEMPVHEFNLKELLCRMIDQCPAPSSMLRECCKKLEQGQITLTLSELLEIMPELVQFAYEQYPHDGPDARAARPDAPPVTANDAVVGKSGCDLTQVLALLAMIKKSINMLKQIICEKFAFTWTILEEILSTFSCAQCIAISTPTTITIPGCYCLSADILGSIIIDADRVILDLNNHQVSGAGNNIDIANNRTDIFIKNGYITTATGNGINVGPNAVNVQLKNISFIDNNVGVFLNGLNNFEIECVKIENCIFRGNTTSAIDGNFVRNSTIENVVCKENIGTFVIQILNGENVSFNTVKVNENLTTAPINIQLSSNITFFNCQVNNNASIGNLNGINLDSNNNVKFNACTINTNTVVGDFIGMNVINSNDIKASGVSINQNNAGTSAIGINANVVNKLNVYNVQANNNTSAANFVYGFSNDGSSDCSYIESHALANGGSNSDTSGFRSVNSTKTMYQDCFANDNLATNTAIGFDLRSSSTSCVLSCIAKRNTATGITGSEVGRGIYLFDSPNCYVERNLVASNTGTLSVGIDVTFTTAPFNTTVFANQAQDHILNYLTTPANILTVFYTRSLATVSATPTPLDNIDII